MPLILAQTKISYVQYQLHVAGIIAIYIYQIICHVELTTSKEYAPEFIKIWLSEVNADR